MQLCGLGWGMWVAQSGAGRFEGVQFSASYVELLLLRIVQRLYPQPSSTSAPAFHRVLPTCGQCTYMYACLNHCTAHVLHFVASSFCLTHCTSSFHRYKAAKKTSGYDAELTSRVLPTSRTVLPM